MTRNGRRLVLASIERLERGLRVGALTRPPERCGDDAAVHSLTIGITDEAAGVPEEVGVTIDGDRSEP